MTVDTTSGAAMLVRSLEAEGVKHLFCIPGAKVDKVLDCLIGTKIKTIVCRHEQNAALIAQGIGRMTGKAGVCLVTSGPGCTNLTTGLATANYEGDPVVALGGAVPLADRLKLAHQSLDAVSLFRPITRFAAEITTGHGIPEVVAAAFRAAEWGRPGAAFLAMPRDVMEAPAPFEHPGPAPRPHLGCPDAAAISAAAQLIGLASTTRCSASACLPARRRSRRPSERSFTRSPCRWSAHTRAQVSCPETCFPASPVESA